MTTATASPDKSAAAGRDNALLAALRAELGRDAVLSGADVPPRNDNDHSSLPPARPGIVLRPSDTAGVAAAMRLCREHGQAVVPQGGLTGLCGGARAIDGALALSLERLTGIDEIDPSSSTITVRAGTPLQVVQQAVDAAGFFFPLDLGARGSCAIGGNLSTNAGGNRVIRYGMARESVLGVEVVLPDGTVVDCMNKMLKNNAGYDLKHLFIGSEGTLGIITKAVLRMFPKPACTMAALCAVKDFDSVVALLGSARRHVGPLLSAFEVMWPDYWAIATGRVKNVRNPFPDSTHGAYVLIEALGTDPVADPPRFEAWLGELLEGGTLPDAAVAQSMSDVQSFWGVRDACAEFYQPPVIGPHLAFDIGLPVDAMARYRDECKAAARRAHPWLPERVLRPHRRRQHAFAGLGSGRRRATRGRRRRSRLRAGAPPSRHRLGRAWHRHAQAALARPCAHARADRADAHAQARARPAEPVESRQGDLNAAPRIPISRSLQRRTE